MATLTVRKLSDTSYKGIAKRAKANNRSLEAEVREILDREVKPFDMKAWIAKLRVLRQQDPIALQPGEDAVSLIREERDSW